MPNITAIKSLWPLDIVNQGIGAVSCLLQRIPHPHQRQYPSAGGYKSPVIAALGGGMKNVGGVAIPVGQALDGGAGDGLIGIALAGHNNAQGVTGGQAHGVFI
jgi:hypothetical protein